MIEQINNSTIMQEIIIDSIKWLLITGACLGIIVGLILFFIPDFLRVYNHKLDHWYSSRKTLKPLEIMRETDSHMYQHNRYGGWAMLAGSGLFLYHFFTWRLPEGALQLLFPDQTVSALMEIVLTTIWIFLAVFIIAGIPLWILLIINPAMLKKLSKVFDHWYSTRLVLLPMETMHYEIDNWILKYSRTFGVIFVLGSMYILITFLFYY